MIPALNAALTGAVAMASFVATLFFLRFWHQTRDKFFLWFAIGFALDAVTRFALAVAHPSNELEPFYYISRLITFGFIIVAIVEKNRPRKPGP
jgi:uncharacterized membrane protein HdeD (DUF308 family)